MYFINRKSIDNLKIKPRVFKRRVGKLIYDMGIPYLYIDKYGNYFFADTKNLREVIDKAHIGFKILLWIGGEKK